MAKKRATKTEAPKTTAQQLGSLIKSARDIMRKDKGLNGDLDRLPMLTWVMFLKFLDDVEQSEESRVQARRQEVPHRPSKPLPLARLGGEERRHHRRRTHQVHQQRRSRASGRQEGAGAVRLSSVPARPQRRWPPRRDRQRVSWRHQPHDLAATCCGMSSIWSMASTSAPPRKSTPSAISTNRCCGRCGTRRAIPASSTRPGPSSASWSRSIDPRLGRSRP